MPAQVVFVKKVVIAAEGDSERRERREHQRTGNTIRRAGLFLLFSLREAFVFESLSISGQKYISGNKLGQYV